MRGESNLEVIGDADVEQDAPGSVKAVKRRWGLVAKLM